MAWPIISVENIAKQYQLGEHQPYLALRDMVAGLIKPRQPRQCFWALKDVSFAVGQGEVIGVIGRNGAGKSTLLKILSKITPPTKGTVRLRGRVASLLEVGTGFHPELTGRENIYLNGAILGMTRQEVRQKFAAIVTFSEIEKFLDTPVKRYSSGMYVRLAFAVAAHLEPEILLIDEVLAVGDIQFQKKCLDKMAEITQTTGRTIVLVSHNMGTIENLCPKSILLEKGRIKMAGPSAQVVNEYLKDTTTIDLADRTDRIGNGEIRLIDITFLNQRGQSSHTFKYGEPMTIKIAYQSDRPAMKTVNFGISIDSNIGHRICDLSTLADSKFPETIPGHGLFICQIPKLQFNAGRYYVSVIVRRSGDIADWVKQATHFDIDYSSAIANRQNLAMQWSSVLMDHSWSVQ